MILYHLEILWLVNVLIVSALLVDLPAPQNLKVIMNLEQNEVFLNWTRPDSEIFSTDLMLSYRLYYTTRGACVMSQCQARLCRVQRRIRSRFDSIMFT